MSAKPKSIENEIYKLRGICQMLTALSISTDGNQIEPEALDLISDSMGDVIRSLETKEAHNTSKHRADD